MLEFHIGLKEARASLAETLNDLILVKANEAKEISASISDGLLGCSRFELSRGGTRKRVSDLQDEVLGFIFAHETYKSLRADDTFMKFANNMCIIAVKNLNLQATDFATSPQKSETFIEHLLAHYQLLREAGVPASIIKIYAHSFSVFEVGKILIDSIEIFGGDPDTADLVRTAANYVLSKKYPTIAEAKHSYDVALADARKVFGVDQDTANLVRTAALKVFERKYASIAEAKTFYTKNGFI